MKPHTALPSVMSVGRIATVRTRRRRRRKSGLGPGLAGSSNDGFSSLDAVSDLHHYFGQRPARDVQFRARAELDHSHALALLEDVVLPAGADDAARDRARNLAHEDAVAGRRALDENVIPLVPPRAVRLARVEIIPRRLLRASDDYRA